MRTRRSRLIHLLAGVSLCAVVTLSACGSDSGSGSGSTDAFCDEIVALSESEDEGDEANLAALQSLADAAPGEISGDMDTLIDAFSVLQATDLETASEDELADLEATVAELDDASANVETFAEDNCPDLPADIFGG